MKLSDVRSPIGLLQEELCHDPWKMIVGCQMLNCTSIKQVRQVVWKFFDRFPSAADCAVADESEIVEIIRPLGFQNRRAKLLKKMSFRYDEFRALPTFDENISALPGVGKYVSDSYQIFIRRVIPDDMVVTDKELKRYVEWARGKIVEQKDVF